MSNRIGFYIIGIVVLSAAGCVPLTPQPDKTRYFLLDNVESKASASTTGVTLGLRPVQMPPYLESARIAIVADGNEVVYSELHRWTEKLNVVTEKALAAKLSRQPGIGEVLVFPWRDPEILVYSLSVQITNFGGDDDGHTVLAGSWTAVDHATGVVLDSGEFSDSQAYPENDYAALARTMGELLDAFAGAIATSFAKR